MRLSLALIITAATAMLLPAAHAESPQPPPHARKQPNILLVVADDLGYSDLPAFGGEIDTPNLDALADEGVRMTSFYTSPFCSPTRSMLMSGTDNHLAGFGAMAEFATPEQKGQPGYEGKLNARIVPLPQLLRDAGYTTLMAGKWHLGTQEEDSPAARGFDYSYAMMQGGAGHFDQVRVNYRDASQLDRTLYRENGKSVLLPENGFYSSEFFARSLISQIEHNRDSGKPFFAYLAFTAPHWPLQAREETIEKYMGRYDGGYEQISAERLARMKRLGIVAQDTEPYTGHPTWPRWAQLTPEQKRIESKRMAVYAAMVDDMDRHLGELIAYLKLIGEYDNTFVLFMSDNGADGNTALDIGAARAWVARHMDNSLENTGKANSFIEYGPGWAQVGSTPFNLYKSFMYEGGISAPAIVRGPGVAGRGAISPAFTHAMDVMPTLLELAGIQHPGTRYQGREVLPMKGRSMLPLLAGEVSAIRGEDDAVGWELGGRKALRKGDWKIVWSNKPWGSGEWELYKLSTDRAERNNLAEANPAKLQELIADYAAYEREVGVIDVPGLADKIRYSNSTDYYEELKK